MKNLLIILFCGFLSNLKAQNSTVDIIQNEFIPTMTTTQRTALEGFDNLRVIDSDDKNTWIFISGKWKREFSDDEITKSKIQSTDRTKSSESWKAFDEASRPVTTISNQSSVEKSEQKSSEVFYSKSRFITISSTELAKSGLNIQPKDGENVAFIKVFVEKSEEYVVQDFQNSIFAEVNSVLIKPMTTIDSNLKLTMLQKDKSNTTKQANYSQFKGVLIGFVSK